MSDFVEIYQTQAALYDRLVAREDYEGNILRTVRQIRPLSHSRVVELGAGTGRVTAILQPEVAHICAFDGSTHMLEQAQQKLGGDVLLATADNRALPLAAGVADIAIAGWSLAHSVAWYSFTWRQEIGKMLAEMRRVLKPGGTLMLLETLGTGRETPMPPTLGLAEFYRWLETEHGFQTTWFRTDYLFASVAEAAQLTRFFFGDNMADDVEAQQLQIVPECTGLWWKDV